jgi:hypothetical protein
MRCYDKQLVHITVILKNKNIFSSLESFQTLQLLNTVVEFRLTRVFMSTLNTIASNQNSLKKNCYMIKYENSTLKIYIRNISKFIPISIHC